MPGSKHLPMQHLAAIWLAAQQRRFAGLAHALLLAADGEGAPHEDLATLPADASVPRALRAASRLALSERRPVLRAGRGSADEAGQARDVIACPLRAGGRLVGAVALELPAADAAEQRQAVQALNEGCAWFEVLLHAESAALGGRLAGVLEVLAAVLEHDGVRPAATALLTELCSRLRCERASLGLLQGRKLRLEALSHSAALDARGSLAGDMTACMREALACGDAVAWRGDADEHALSPAHAALATRDGACAILTLPLPDASGAVTLERFGGRPFTREEREVAEAALTLAAPVLALKREVHRPLPARALRLLGRTAAGVLGPGHLAAKSTLAAIAAAALLLGTVEAEFRVAAPASLEGSVQRAVAAPQDGFVAAASARAGDVVRAGEELARLDDRDLTLERRKWAGRAAQLSKEYRDALANHDRAQVSILGARIDQAEAEVALLDEQLARTRVLAPIDGIVLSGDLSQSLGAPVSRGDVLFEVAPLDGYRVALEVDERDVAHLAPGQTGRLALAARPGQPLDLVVQRVTPVARTENGRHHFRVDAALATRREDLRPGMQGVAKVLVDERSIGWIWSRRLLDWLQLAAWRWLP